MKPYIFFVAALILGCASVKREFINSETFKIRVVSTDPTYGYSPENAVRVGGYENSEGPKNERRFLNALLGPNGETVEYRRVGSCCPVKSSKAIVGDQVLLDRYAVYWQGSPDTLMLYINMYDADVLQVPLGFKAK